MCPSRRWCYRLLHIVLSAFAVCSAGTVRADQVYLGSGAKAGEITDTSAIVHVRLTAAAEQNEDQLIPGREGRARLKYGRDEALGDAATTDWREAKAHDDYSIQFFLDGLEPGSRYYYKVEYRADGQAEAEESDLFSFKTAPAPHVRATVKFQVTTGQDYRGADTYLAMAAEKPDFLVSTGDNVYYDGAARAHDVPGAYRAYQKMYGLAQMKAYFRHVGGYFEKDDHDYRFNDCDRWMKGKPYGKKKAADRPDLKIESVDGKRLVTNWLTHEEGIMVFKKVFPMSEKTYRTFRWGQGVEIWLTEGRDYRSPNNMPDGPDKTLWGKEQLAWLKRTLLESDADFRVLISPTPIIGPDRQTKRDNHANRHGFWTEGQAFLDWISKNRLSNLVLVCGDRHWQYHSVDRRNGRHVHEFSCGPTCDEHTANVPPPFEGVTQPYAASKGGFLTVTYQPDRTLTFEFHYEDGTSAYRYSFQTAP